MMKIIIMRKKKKMITKKGRGMTIMIRRRGLGTKIRKKKKRQMMIKM
jgi:hypothetical protein